MNNNIFPQNICANSGSVGGFSIGKGGPRVATNRGYGRGALPVFSDCRWWKYLVSENMWVFILNSFLKVRHVQRAPVRQALLPDRRRRVLPGEKVNYQYIYTNLRNCHFYNKNHIPCFTFYGTSKEFVAKYNFLSEGKIKNLTSWNLHFAHK